MKEKLFVGIDVGGTKISAALVTEYGKILTREKVETPPQGPAILAQLKRSIEFVLQIANKDKLELSGIGIGVPGVVKPDHQTILITPNIRLTRYPLAKNLMNYFKVPVVLGNDVNLGLMGERWLGAGKSVGNLIGIFPGTGVGGAIMINGQLYTGTNGAAAELGHMIMDIHSPLENAGVFGSLEVLASRRAIERRIREKIREGKKSIIEEISDDTKQIKSGVLHKALLQRDRVVVEVFNDVCEVIGKACISLRHILNPEMIILGGGVIEACGQYMLPRIRKISAADPFFQGIDDCQIVSSLLGDDAIIYGAVALVKQSLGIPLYISEKLYPRISDQNGGGISIGDKIYRNNVYVRADGKVKDLKEKADFAILNREYKIGPEQLLKLCKKDPDILVVADATGRLKLTKPAADFLKAGSIEYKILPRQEAIQYYNRLNRRKSILICQK